MPQGLKFYDWLNRIPFTPSFRAKVIFAVLASVLTPVAMMEVYFIAFSSLAGEELNQAIRVSMVAAALASVLAYWALSKILRPVLETSEQLRQFVSDRVMPELPGHYRDEVGILMSNVNYVARSLKELAESEKQNGSMDHLTGILNRRSAESRLRDSIELTRIRQGTLSFSILDIDNFKILNDTYGHDFGDRVLRQIGDLLRTNVRRTDWVGRWGGDEFVISVEGGEREASAMLSRICELIRRQVVVAPDRTEHRITFSCGVCEWNEALDPQSLFTNADEALYTAKRAGRNQVQVWSEMATAQAGF